MFGHRQGGVVELATQAGGLADRDKAARIVEKLEAARRTLADPVARGIHLLDLSGGAADAPTKDTPPGFRPSSAGEYDRLNAEAARLFRQLGSADPRAVQRERRRQIRQTLNAIRMLADESSDR